MGVTTPTRGVCPRTLARKNARQLCVRVHLAWHTPTTWGRARESIKKKERGHNLMKTEKFDRKMRSQLRTLTTVAEDIEELANEFTSYRLQQAGLEKAARVYDAIYAIQYALDELMLEGGEGANGKSVSGFLPFVPPTVTHNDLEAYTVKRGGKVVAKIRKSDKLKAAEDMMRPYVERLARGKDYLPLRGAVRETVKVCWPCGDAHEQGEPRSDAPDLDNWVKTFNDLCEGAGIISCDAHIVEEHLYKAWADPAGVYVRFEEVADGRA